MSILMKAQCNEDQNQQLHSFLSYSFLNVPGHFCGTDSEAKSQLILLAMEFIQRTPLYCASCRDVVIESQAGMGSSTLPLSDCTKLS